MDAPVGERLSQDALIGVGRKIWVLAAQPDVITRANVDRLSGRLIVEGASIPGTRALATSWPPSAPATRLPTRQNSHPRLAKSGLISVVREAARLRRGGRRQSFGWMKQ